MSCTAYPITSPSISCLDFLLAWDISGAQPIVTVTNNSATSNNANLKWWFYVVSPSGVPIYGEDLNGLSSLPTPDVNGVAWTTKVVNLPTPFGNGTCAQVEFSPNSPFRVYVFVSDTAAPSVPFNQFSKSTIIVRPNGNTNQICGNYGAAAVDVNVDCSTRKINAFDSTNLGYNNIITPLTTTNLWTLVYPQDATQNIPIVEVSNVPNVSIATSINSKGYTLYFNEFSTYDYGNGVTVKVQYKLFDASNGNSLGRTFAINCDTNLCLLHCQLAKFYALSKSCCGTLEIANLNTKMTQVNFLFNQIVIGIFQPLCGVDVPALIDQIKILIDADDNCDCGCGGSNFGFSNPGGTGSGVGGCCPISVGVINGFTGVAPANCPNSYFPVDVYGPGGLTSPPVIIGTAYSVNDLVAILNSNSQWQVYGVAFAQGNCKIGWFAATGVTVIPDVVVTSAAITPILPIIVDVIDTDTSVAPAECPASYFPVTVYQPDGVTILGVANNITELVNAINGSALWQAYGVASYNGSLCTVTFTPNTGVITIPDIKIKKSSGCVGNKINLNLVIKDPCTPSYGILTPSAFPCDLYIDWNNGSGLHKVGNVADKTALIAALNADSLKPGSVTIVDNVSVFSSAILNEVGCIYTSTPFIYCDLGSGDFLLYGANHSNLINVKNGFASEIAVGAKTMTRLGTIPTALNQHIPFHTIRIGNYLINAETDTGKVRFYDVANPLTPTLVNTVQLDSPVGTCFTGVPNSIYPIGGTSKPSFYGLYFPTDYYAPMSIEAICVVESITGSIWKLGLSAGLVSSFQDDKLLGKCPRVITGGKIYFTQDGDVETYTTSSGVAAGDIVILDLSDFTSTGLSTTTIFQNNLQNVWAASFDGIDTIWFSGTDVNTASGLKSSVAKYVISTTTVARYLHICNGTNWQKRANTTYYAGKLYFVVFWMNASYMISFVSTSDIGVTNTFTTFNVLPPNVLPAVPVYYPFNFKPLGNCYGVVTASAGNVNSITKVFLYKLDGTFVNSATLSDSEAIYNIIPFGGFSSYIPNSLTP